MSVKVEKTEKAEAEEAASAVAAKYPDSENITFIIDDLSFPAED